ncbi:hypothetical protein SAMN05444682_10331 [Parapedobacter indicus]|uniref:Uncharacterized protein n=1 Tax=Parapedobacter indicus TaxID=1477437 RepID=A0A1I3GMA0_9SPHI|nr:hypothetical protein CLV26_10332 [Parapedobacter indicus]SFI24526.1 hypothetical protein SAMN05444682_10331 [Parapedobacter indicus]
MEKIIGFRIAGEHSRRVMRTVDLEKCSGDYELLGDEWPNEPESSAIVGPCFWLFRYSAIIAHPLATARGAPSEVRLRTL